MTQTALVFFPHNPFPPKTGAHKRCLEVLSGLRDSGFETILFSSTWSSETPWNEESIHKLESHFVKRVIVYQPVRLDHYSTYVITRLYRVFGRQTPLSSMANIPLGMCLRFSKVTKEVSPDLILMNYAWFDCLVEKRNAKEQYKVIETHDLITLNTKMRQALAPLLNTQKIRIDDVDDQMLDENFFTQLALTPDAEEFQIYDRYDYTIAISEEEAEIIRQHTKKTKVLLIPVTQEAQNIANNYTGHALFPMGPNPFNIQGYLYFAKKVLPKILEAEPSFQVDVTGSPWNNVVLEPTPHGIAWKGFVPDLVSVYAQARLLICPVFGGTGQQVKVVEAMAHGVPVVALKQAAKRSPIKHKVNGFIASDADEFAHYCTLLWQNQPLCQELGQAARETIANEFSRQTLLEKLASIF